MDQLPNDIHQVIFSNMTCKQLELLYILGLNIHKDIICKSVFRGFPRKIKAKCHLDTLKHKLYQDIFLCYKYYQNPEKEIKRLLGESNVNLIEYSKDYLIQWFKNIINSDIFVYGDYIRSNLLGQTETYVYTGTKMEIYKPGQFRVLENNIPLNYWRKITQYVNIDIRPYREMTIKHLEQILDDCQTYIGEHKAIFYGPLEEITEMLNTTDVIRLMNEKSELVWYNWK